MNTNDEKLLNAFEIPITYYELTKEVVEKLHLTNSNVKVKFISDKTFHKRGLIFSKVTPVVVENLLTVREGNELRVVTDKDMFKLPKNATGVFQGCKAESLDLSIVDTSEVENMSYLFADSSIHVLNLSSFNTSNVTNMCGMFSDSSISNLDLSSFNTKNVTTMDSMFRAFRGKNIDISSFRTPKLINMSSMFYDCYTDKIDLHYFNTKNVRSMHALFFNIQVRVLNLDNIDLTNVDDLNGAFLKMEIIDSFTMKNVKGSFKDKVIIAGLLKLRASMYKN